MPNTVGIFYAYWTRDWEVDFFPYVKKVKSLGFDQLEIHGAVLAGMTPEARHRLRKEAEDQHILLSYGIGLTADHDMSSTNETVRKNAVAFMKSVVKAMGEMGGGMIGGTIHSCWPSTLPAGAIDKRPYLEKSLLSVKELVKVAEDHDVTLNVEVINRFEQYLLNTCAEALAYVKEVNSPRCKILLDTFHMNIEEDSIGGAIRAAGPHLASLHLGETNRKPPGMGRMPWAEIHQALKDISYHGPLVMEPFIVPGGQIGRDIGVWRPIVEHPDLDALARDAVVFVRKNLM